MKNQKSIDLKYVDLFQIVSNQKAPLQSLAEGLFILII